MSQFNRARDVLAASSARQLAIYFTAGIGALYILLKLLRSATARLFPDFFPGEPNTALLASPRPDTSSEVSAKDVDNVRAYDYVIVGGGTAGCVIANRLTADPSVSVLVIETGHSDLKQLFSRIPAGFGQLFKTVADYALKTQKEPGCKNREMFWPRGKMLGGCSSINAMMYNKGAAEDWDEFERLGNSGWGYSTVSKYMRKQEHFNASQTHPLSAEEMGRHGRDGPWQVGYQEPQPTIKDWVKACDAVGIPPLNDNSLCGPGSSLTQTFIDTKGQRSSTAVAYLTKDVASRSNLKIATGQTVTKIVFDRSGAEPRAVGVEMSTAMISPIRYLVRAKREVIVCAGAVHTPQVLKLSGIGPADELKKHNIPLVKDLKGVGANLADHLLGMVVSTSKKPSLQYLTSPIKSLPALVEWIRFGTGGMTTNAAEALCFFKTADRADAPKSLKDHDLSSGPKGMDLEILAGPLAYIEHGFQVPKGNKDYFSCGPIILRPESRGTITLSSSSPFDAPIIKANYLSTKHDLEIMKYGLKVSRDIMRSKQFEHVFDEWYFPSKDPNDMSDAEVEDFLRGSIETVYHPMCSAKMGPAQDSAAVVDERLRVHGVKGLRVADASIFPKPMACHPCSPVVTVGEKAADLIKEDKA